MATLAATGRAVSAAAASTRATGVTFQSANASGSTTAATQAAYVNHMSCRRSTPRDLRKRTINDTADATRAAMKSVVPTRRSASVGTAFVASGFRPSTNSEDVSGLS